MVPGNGLLLCGTHPGGEGDIRNSTGAGTEGARNVNARKHVEDICGCIDSLPSQLMVQGAHTHIENVPGSVLCITARVFLRTAFFGGGMSPLESY